ncbi:MAG TPA: nitroreductase family protein [Burkholderiaceae bacterium]|nr:nitroreductase family protein [Burkholderiaceae bacterium]
MTDLISNLQWRYATKKMRPTKPVPADKVARIVEAVRLSPSANGLQPYQVIVVSNKAVLEKLKVAANGQSQITDGSHLLVFAAWDNYTPERINHFFDLAIQVRGGGDAAWENYRQQLIKNFGQRDAKVNFEHAARQAFLGLGVALVAAAEERVDSTPMEGFNAQSVDEILNLSDKGLKSVAIMPLGYRDEANDWLLKQDKVRRSSEMFVINVL